MDQFCERCGQADAFSPDDHDCARNLIRQLNKITSGITSDAGWDSLTRDGLLKIEEELAAIYESLRSLTEYYTTEMEKARQTRDAVYSSKQVAAGPLNHARAEIRNRMESVE